VGASYSLGIAAGDVDGDSKLDLVATHGGGEVATCLGLGNGSFAPPTYVQASDWFGLALADLDGDARLDLAAPRQHEIGLLLGDGTGHFGTGSLTPIPSSLGAAEFADLDSNGLEDLVTGDAFAPKLYVNLATGPGSFAAPTVVPAVSWQLLALGHFDAGAAIDAVVVYLGSIASSPATAPADSLRRNRWRPSPASSSSRCRRAIAPRTASTTSR
jgi:hypothetical protein